MAMNCGLRSSSSSSSSPGLNLYLKALNEKVDTLDKVLGKKGDPLEEEDGCIMRAMGLNIQSLINEQENIKESSCSSYFRDNIKAIEDEVRLIRDESSKMNSDIHSVWALAKDATEKVEALHSDIKKGPVLTDEWGKMNSSINRLWSFVKGTEKKVEGLCLDIKKVQRITGEWEKMNFDRMWSFAKDTEKKVEGLYSDIKWASSRRKGKCPSCEPDVSTLLVSDASLGTVTRMVLRHLIVFLMHFCA